MQTVYLDQNVASFLANPKPQPIWKEIRQALTDGFHRGKLICPLPFECIMESASLPLEFRKSIQTLFWELSDGWAFKSFTDISDEQTLALVRPIPGWSPWLKWEPVWAEMESVAMKIKIDWNAGKEQMTKRMDNFVRSSNLEKMSELELFHTVAAQRSGWICSDLDCLLEGKAVEASLHCPGLIEFLTFSNLSPSEVRALKEAVQHHAWAKIAVHTFEILLGAKWEYDCIKSELAARKPAKYHPNDEIDRMRAAIPLSHADLFITEADLASLCQKAKASDYCRTLVLSVKCPTMILKTIRSIIKNESRQSNV